MAYHRTRVWECVLMEHPPCTDEASYRRPIREQDRRSESLARLASLTNEQSRSGSSVQQTALYNGAAAFGNTNSLPSAFKVNISTRTLITRRNQLTANSRAKEAETSHPVCGQDGAQTTHALISSRAPTIRPGALPAICAYRRKKKQQLI
ncbi:hypothetical protein FHG87_014232 [Trinorchestia longiramus]|nr:hypothetical protein FHG87_014232 [Trinorchestia longiramus]